MPRRSEHLLRPQSGTCARSDQRLLDEFDALKNVINDLGDGMSKAAGQLIATQMAAEKVRQQEMPEQLCALQAALTEGAEAKRVVIVIDELDRCHPDYAIAVLEAMKLIFNQAGFVFCLMVNADYLENLAKHRFGNLQDDEKYLDKFVDIRLRLQPENASLHEAVALMATELPLRIPFGEGNEFSVQSAAELAGALAVDCELSMRKAKRVLLKVEMALRCYSERPLDASLLVILSFEDAVDNPFKKNFLPRSRLTPEEGKNRMIEMEAKSERELRRDRGAEPRAMQMLREDFQDLINLPPDRYGFPDQQVYKDWARVFGFLAPHYLPMHRDVLNAVAELLVPATED